MPTYGYECTACSDKFEILQSIKDAALSTCEKCGGALKKLIYPIGIAFKGSGFYVNDYAAKPAGAVAKSGSETKSESSTEAKAETKTETKSDTKTDTPASTTPAATPAAAASTA